eukprot:c22152_g2_i1 orf=53-769(+)
MGDVHVKRDMPQVNGTWESRLNQAKPFLRGSFDSVDPSLPIWLSILREKGASECYHKHSTFYEHLLSVYRILKLWNVPDVVARVGLFHSCYSNSFVNLTIFEPDVSRETVRDIIGDVAEQLVHLFCIVPRQELIYDMMLLKFNDDELLAAFHGDKLGVVNEVDSSSYATQCKSKLAAVIPPEGFIVKHIRTGEDVQVPRRVLAIFLLLTMADLIEQLYSYQDALFEHENGNLTWAGNN